jgi:twitching motility two-component system response regulator PilH
MAKILIVDDSPTQVSNLSRMLEPHGHKVISAENGVDGIAMAQAEQPDLILMDVVMPEMNGFQATRKLTRDPATGHIPVIIVSTKDQETDRIWGLRQGAKGYLVKPPAEAELLEMVGDLLR